MGVDVKLKCLTFLLDTSKRRHLYRTKQTVAKKKLEELLKEYCVFFDPDKICDVESMCQTGVFPWVDNERSCLDGSGIFLISFSEIFINS